MVESRLLNLLFSPLHLDGSNFLEWINDARTVLCAEDLAKTLIHPQPAHSPNNSTDEADNVPLVSEVPAVSKWQALALLRRHMDQALRMQYLEVDDPADLWAQIQARFDHQQTLFLPQARTDWANLRVLDFSDFATFNSELHRIVAQLRLCGQRVTEAEMVEKTLSTFPPTTAILSQQYRNMKFKKHANLMSHLLLAKKHQQLLLKNAESRPAREVHTTDAAVPAVGVETYAVEASRRPSRGFYRKSYPSQMAREKGAYGKSDVHKGYHKRDENTRREPPRPRSNQFKPRNFQPRQFQGNCHKCGRKGNFAKDCRAPSYITNMYRELQ